MALVSRAYRLLPLSKTMTTKASFGPTRWHRSLSCCAPSAPIDFADVKAAAEKLYAELLAAGVDVILDDRNERPGAMFADWELIGVPHRVTIGDRALKEGVVEYQHRRDTEATKVPVAEIAGLLLSRLKA